MKYLQSQTVCVLKYLNVMIKPLISKQKTQNGGQLWRDIFMMQPMRKLAFLATNNWSFHMSPGFLICAAFLLSCDEKKVGDPLNESVEINGIMQTIEGETNAFFNGNYEEWSSYWSHDSMAMQAWNNSDGTADAAIGWEQINQQGKYWIDTYYKNGENIIHPEVKKEAPRVMFFDDKTAYLMWKQYNADQDKVYYRVSQETRLMKKEEGKWKILNVSAFWDTQQKIGKDSLEID